MAMHKGVRHQMLTKPKIFFFEKKRFLQNEHTILLPKNEKHLPSPNTEWILAISNSDLLNQLGKVGHRKNSS
jgi:hypothetical protein